MPMGLAVSANRLTPAVALLLLFPLAARAQVLEVRGGVTTTPVIGFADVRIGSTPRPERPLTYGFSLGFGSGRYPATLFTIRIADFWLGKAHPSLEFKGWSPRVGMGVALLIGRDLAPYQGGDEIAGSWALLLGAEHRNRMSVEVAVNFFGGPPRALFMVGYRLH